MVEYCRLSLQFFCIATMSPRICQQLSIILFTGLPERRRGVGGHGHLRGSQGQGSQGQACNIAIWAYIYETASLIGYGAKSGDMRNRGT